jgi:hypothetical protein
MLERVEVSRTLVKSLPELWTELSGERLLEALGDGTIRPTEDERALEWEAGGVQGTAVLEPAGWGTKVTLSAEVEEEVRHLEHQVAKHGWWTRLRGHRPEQEQVEAPPEPRRLEVERRLTRLLDELGSARRKPFQAG